MANLILLLGFVISAYNRALGRMRTSRGAAVFSLVTAGALAFGSGLLLAAREDARSRYGIVTAGTVVEKLSSNGEDGTRTFGPGRWTIVRTDEGFQLHEIVARRLVTGSMAAWVVDYKYPCGRSSPCWGREFVDHGRWAGLRRGDRVDVRWVPDGFGGVRLASRSRWTDAFVEMTLGGLMLAAAKATAAAGPLTRPKRKADSDAEDV